MLSRIPSEQAAMPESSGTSEEAEQTLKALQDSWEQALKPLSEELSLIHI